MKHRRTYTENLKFFILVRNSAMRCYMYGTGQVLNLANHEYAHLILVRALDVVDDTVLLNSVVSDNCIGFTKVNTYKEKNFISLLIELHADI